MIFNVPRGISQVKRQPAAGGNGVALRLRSTIAGHDAMRIASWVQRHAGGDCAWSVAVKKGMMGRKIEIFGIEFGFDHLYTIII